MIGNSSDCFLFVFRLAQMAEEHEKELNAAVERSVHARKQASTVQEQLSMLQ